MHAVSSRRQLLRAALLCLLAAPCGAADAFFAGCGKASHSPIKSLCYFGFSGAAPTSFWTLDLPFTFSIGEGEPVVEDAPDIDFVSFVMTLRRRWGGRATHPGEPRWELAAGGHWSTSMQPVEQLGLTVAQSNYGPVAKVGVSWPYKPWKPALMARYEWQVKAPSAESGGISVRLLVVTLSFDLTSIQGQDIPLTRLAVAYPLGQGWWRKK